MVNIPLLSTLFNTVKSQLETYFETTIPTYGFSMLRGFAAVHSANLKTLYLVLAKVQKNVFPDTAEPEASGGTLERFGRVFLQRDPFPAIQGQYICSVGGTTGATIPAATVFQTNTAALNPGYNFILDNAYTLTGSADQVQLRALTAGVEAMENIGDVLFTVSPVPNIDRNAAIVSEAVSPVDAESLELYRTNILNAIRLLAGSWSAVDYRLVGGAIAGVENIYAYAVSGQPNEVNVWIEGTTPGTPPGAPTIAAVQTATELVRPLGIFQVNYDAAPINLVEVTINQTTVLTTAQRNLIDGALKAAVTSVRPFIAAADILTERNDTLATDFTAPYSTNIINVIAAAIPSVPFGAVTFTVDGVPSTSTTFDFGNIPYLNAVNYV